MVREGGVGEHERVVGRRLVRPGGELRVEAVR